MAEQRTVDLTNCDREPIHIPGSIQPHGCLIACDEALQFIQRASANAHDFLGLEGALLGRPLADLFAPSATHEIRNAALVAQQSARPALLPNIALQENGPRFDVAVHRYKGAAIIECERAIEAASPLDTARALISGISRAQSVEELTQRAPRLIRGVLGYDRVMIYAFAHDGAGKVIGESRRSDLEGFLGQHFPASDIPQQARALYLQNTIRIISDASDTRVAVEPVLNASGEPLDLSFAHLRSVSSIHCEYLRNMGVGASMSISIIVDGKLWGLIACHHYAPRTLSMPQRLAAEMFGEFFSLQLEALSRKYKLESAARARRALNSVLRDVTYHGDIAALLRAKLEDFSTFMPCDGVGVWIDGIWAAQGIAPSPKAIPALARFLTTVADGKVWATHELSAQLPAAADQSPEVAGVLAIPLSQIPKDYLIFFRQEVLQTVDWAGDPNKQYEVGPLGDRLTPRKSFAIWKETVERQSVPWTEDDREMAEAARTALLEVVMRHSEILETERKTADLRQKLLNEELNHRVKNILALIKSLVSQPVQEDRDLSDYVASLKGRIMALAHAHDQIIRNDGGGALHKLLDAELTPYRAHTAEIAVSGPDLLLDSRAYSVMALAIHELATNAAKYGALSAQGGRLKVRWELEAGDCILTWAESDGPPVTPPKREGFGSILLSRSVPFDLGGESQVFYELHGVSARFRIPARFISRADTTSEEPTAPTKAGAAAGAVSGLNIMVLEDQLVIAMDLEAMLADGGAASIDTVATAAEALRLLAGIEPDVCVLDVNLGSGTSLPVAEELMRRKIPFVFATGYGDSAMIPPSLAAAPVVRKPYDANALYSAIGRARTASEDPG